MPKQIVICCDGTGNEYGDRNSNVIKLYKMLTRTAEKQVAYYHPGVGTMGAKNALSAVGKVWTKIRGLAFGYGLSDNIADAYQYLMKMYDPGDQIYIFGFSRGAYTARALCGMLKMFGLLSQGNEGLIPYAIRLFKSGKEDKFEIAAGFKKTFCVDCKPYFLGLWDTVSSVGWILDPIGLKPWRMPYTTDLPDLSVIRHAVSIDERRAFFRQNLIHVEPDDKRIKQIWFAGVHSDVGGSYPEAESGLSKIALKWMLDEAERAGLDVDKNRVKAILGGEKRYAAPAPDAKMHNSLTPAWWLGEFWPKSTRKRFGTDPKGKPRYIPWVRVNLFRRRYIPDGACIHASVLERQKLVPRYNPSNLPKTYTQEPPKAEGATAT